MTRFLALLPLLLFSLPAFAGSGVSLDSLVSVLIYVVVAGLIFWLLWWLVGYVGLPEPFNKVARVILAVVAVVFLINLLLSFAGHPLIRL